MNKKHNLKELFETVTDYFSPKIIGEVNDVYVKIARVKGGDVPWHTHDHEDELFYVLSGSLIMEIRNHDSVTLAAGELFIVPRGTEHRVYSTDECRLLLIEKKSTKHTGDVQTTITKSIDEQRY